MSETVKFNKKAARRLVKEKDFNEDEALVCVVCGRTVIRSQYGGSPHIFCTCERRGPPMISITEEDND